MTQRFRFFVFFLKTYVYIYNNSVRTVTMFSQVLSTAERHFSVYVCYQIRHTEIFKAINLS